MIKRPHPFSFITQPHPEEGRQVRLEGRGVSSALWNLLRDAAEAAPQDEVRGQSTSDDIEGSTR